MRVHVYSEELTNDIELVKKKSSNGTAFYGVRLYLASHDVLHHTTDDDDRSAVTFWIPNAEAFGSDDLKNLFLRAAAMLSP